MKRIGQCLALGLALIFQACAQPTWNAARQAAMDPDKEWKYTERQAAIAAERAVLSKAARFNKDKGVWELDLNVVTVEDMLKVLQDRVQSLDDLLSYKDEHFSRLIDWFGGFRKGLEKEEKIALWFFRRLQYADTFNKFTDLVGDLPVELLGKEAEYFFPRGRKTYSLRLIYPGRDLRKIPLTVSYVETAKSQGVLIKVDSFTVADSQLYGKKVLGLQDPNEFSWEKEYRGWVIESYKILPTSDEPANNVVQYIEVYRTTERGVRESLPAVRGFLATGGDKVTVFVVDYDKEGEDGFGEPDTVKRIFSDIVTGRDLYTNTSVSKELLEPLYERPENDRKRPERRKPPERLVYAEIVPMGKKLDMAVWEEGAWSVPIEYQSLSKNLEVVFRPPLTPEEKKLLEKEKLQQIALLVRRFKQAGSDVAIEYWHPIKEYAERNMVKAEANYDGTFSIRRKGMGEERADIEYFANKKTGKPRQIDYLFGGKWFRIVDENGDGVYEKKREIADPSRSTNASTQPYHGMQ